MADEIGDHLAIHIGAKLQVQSPISSNCSIMKVPQYLRNVYPPAYEPHILAIGPYHSGKSHLNGMEKHKTLYLKLLLQRRGETDVTRYVTAMRALEERARKCYTEPMNLEQGQFVEMMLLDACFITELLRKYKMANFRENDDPIFSAGYAYYSESPMSPVNHLLEFIHHNWQPSCSRTMRNCRKVTGERKYREVIRCATELKEAGIKFMKVEGESLFDIKFENGIVKLPRLNIDDDAEPLVRNLIVYEQFSSQEENPNYVTDYMNLMECLITSAKDVELLCQHGIINNCIGDDQVMANIFNTIGFFLVLSPESYYSQVFDDVNEHCSRRWNKWMANLRVTYFNSPWSFISFLAAFFLLIFLL
ncbi:hypothetical protein OWV82_006344 [Melia azedarach]|uniref:Uncharacterized protein n=1 Tax=Melia azedarach TaxID=155640 RepID=A0ACC1YHA2_MELAZ|nr:hypothetical protein OWV82_006344 [Melia azedarach]